MILVFIFGFAFIVGRPKLNLVAAAHKSIDLPNVIHYLPKREEELEYWLT